MATNFKQPGEDMYLATASGAESGDPMVLGSYLPCVLLTDADSDSPYKATVRNYGVFDLSVEAVDTDGPSAVVLGDSIYYDDGNDPVLTKKSDGKFFGVALEAIASGTDTIKVLLRPKAGLGGVTAETLSSALQDMLVTLTFSDADQTDGTSDVTIQVLDADGNDLKENTFIRVWTGSAEDYGVDALTGITATTGTVVNSHTSNGDVDVVTDANGTAVLSMDKGSAGDIYIWGMIQGRVYESGAVSITGP